LIFVNKGENLKMESCISKNKQTKPASYYYTRIAGVFTAKIRAICLLLVTATFAIPAWQAWQSFNKIKTVDAQLQQIISLKGTYKHIDEALTMELNMAVTTGDSKYISRFEKAGHRINPVVEENWNISQDSKIRLDAVLAAFAGDQLTTIENSVRTFIKQGNEADAAIMLKSMEYQDQKDKYNMGMNAFVDGMQQTLQERYDKHWKNIQYGLIAICIILPGIVMAWLAYSKAGNSLHIFLKKKRKEDSVGREWQETFNAITDGVCIIDKDGGTILQCNKAMARLLKMSHDDIIGQNCCQLIHGTSEPVRNCPLARMQHTRHSEATDFKVGDKWLNIKVDPLINKDGKLIGAVHILSDTTANRKANRALRDSENKFKLAFANAQDAIIWIDSESGLITNCNKASEELFGKRKNELIGQHHSTLYPEQTKDRYNSILSESENDLKNIFEAEILTRGGDTRIVTIVKSAMFVDDRIIIQGIIRDITESKKAIEEARNLARFPREDPNPVLRISQNCDVLYANDASKPVLETWQIDTGQTLPEPWCTRIKEVYGSGLGATFEMICNDGHIFFITLQPINDLGYVNAYGLDITNRKKAEKDKMDLELLLSQKQKMEAIGTLAGGIAHDFNNILAAIQGYAELSLDDLPQESPSRESVGFILSCTERATKLVKQILTFSRKEEQIREKEPIQISSIIKEVLEMLRSSLPTTIKICRKIQAASSIVLADSTQIHQVLVNLCTNASHAMREHGGTLEVSLTDVDLKQQTMIGDELLQQGSYVKLSVSDTGCGMNKEVLKRIFEPFFTTKGVNEGTGLGLSVVHGIVESHNGAIDVRSTPGEGTTFDVYFPRIETCQAQDAQPPEPAIKTKDTILLVDDEEMMVDVIGRILERLGYAVVAKTGSIDALETFQEKPDEFDLVITDQIMPNMTGTQLAEKLIAIKPEIPVILCSGFPENISEEELSRIGIKEFIAKPVSRHDIAAIVEKFLQKKEVAV
jgi:PAS domain S-box-containing protein